MIDQKHESITHKVLDIFASYTSVPEDELIRTLVTGKLNFEEADIDSLELLDVFFYINQEFDIHLPQKQWAKTYTNPHSQDANGLRLYTLESIIAEIRTQLTAKAIA